VVVCIVAMLHASLRGSHYSLTEQEVFDIVREFTCQECQNPFLSRENNSIFWKVTENPPLIAEHTVKVSFNYREFQLTIYILNHFSYLQ